MKLGLFVCCAVAHKIASPESLETLPFIDAPMPSPLWHYVQEKKKVGPVSLARLLELYSQGQLGPADMVLRDGAATWVRLDSVLLSSQAAGSKPDHGARSRWLLLVGGLLVAVLATMVIVLIRSRAGDDKSKIAVVGCPDLLLGVDAPRPDERPTLALGTRLTILAEKDHRFEVQSSDGAKGWLPRWGICSLEELERRQRENQVPEQVGEIVHDAGQLFLRGKFRIRDGNPSFEKGQAFWLGPTMVGQTFKFNHRQVTGDPSVLYFPGPGAEVLRLPVWGNPDSVQVVEADAKPKVFEEKSKPDKDTAPPEPPKLEVKIVRFEPDPPYWGDTLVVFLQRLPPHAQLEYRLLGEKSWRLLKEDKLERPHITTSESQLWFRAVLDGKASDVLYRDWPVQPSPLGLLDPRPNVRSGMAATLDTIKIPDWYKRPQAAQAIPALLPALKDPDDSVKSAAMQALDRIADHWPSAQDWKTAIPHLTPFMEKATWRSLVGGLLKKIKADPEPGR